MPLRRLPRTRPTGTATVTTQPDRSNRWYPTQDTTPSPAGLSPAPLSPLKGEVSVLTRPSFPQPPAPVWNPPPPSQGSFVCFTQQKNKGGVSSETFHFNTPYQYFYQQSTLRQAGFMEQGRIIANPLAGGPNTQHVANPQTQLSLNAAQQYMTNNNKIPFNNPYFDMNNVRNQISGLQGYGACTGNPFISPNFFNHPVQTNMFNPTPYPNVGQKRNAQTNTTLKLTHQATKPRDKLTKSRDQATETTLVFGSKKRNRTQKVPTKRLIEHLAAPGAERKILEIKRRQVGVTNEDKQWRHGETAEETSEIKSLEMEDEQLVLEIKVENSREIIMDSMIEIAEKEVQTDLTDKSSPGSLPDEQTSQLTFAQVVSGGLTVETPIKTTSIEEIFTGESIKTTKPDMREAENSEEQVKTPQTPLTPLTPLSPGFEWCEEYEYELVDHNEQDMEENEEALDIELDFDLDSPQSVNSPGSAN